MSVHPYCAVVSLTATRFAVAAPSPPVHRIPSRSISALPIQTEGRFMALGWGTLVVTKIVSSRIRYSARILRDTTEIYTCVFYLSALF